MDPDALAQRERSITAMRAIFEERLSEYLDTADEEGDEYWTETVPTGDALWLDFLTWETEQAADEITTIRRARDRSAE